VEEDHGLHNKDLGLKCLNLTQRICLNGVQEECSVVCYHLCDHTDAVVVVLCNDVVDQI
jgi:hypothetical protein